MPGRSGGRKTQQEQEVDDIRKKGERTISKPLRTVQDLCPFFKCQSLENEHRIGA